MSSTQRILWFTLKRTGFYAGHAPKFAVGFKASLWGDRLSSESSR